MSEKAAASIKKLRLTDHSEGATPWYEKLAASWQLWVMVSLPLVYLILFRFVPMYGAQIAFRDYEPFLGVEGSPWVGFRHFSRFFSSYEFGRVVWNTISLNLFVTFGGLPIPLILALSLNMAGSRRFRKSVQMITYMPYFISTVIMVTLIVKSLDSRYGFVTLVLRSLGFAAENIMGEASLFKLVYFVSSQWQFMGYASIIYLAALAGVAPELHEAAVMDGAGKVQRIWHVDLPGVLPTIVVILILRAGRVMNIDFEKIYLMQNSLNLRTAEVISTYVYKLGLLNADYSFATAVGLFNSVLNLILIVSVNHLARRLGEHSLW